MSEDEELAAIGSCCTFLTRCVVCRLRTELRRAEISKTKRVKKGRI